MKKILPIFPNVIDDNYSANVIVKLFFYILTGITIIRSLIHIFYPDGGSQSIAGIPIEIYSTQAANTVIGIFAFWGVSQLLMGLIYLIVSIKYKSLIPLMLLINIIEYSSRFIITFYKPFVTTHVAPGAIGNYIMIPLLLLIFIMSCIGEQHKNH